MAEPDRIIAEANAALVRADGNPEAVLHAAVDALSEARRAIWVASLMTRDPSVMRVVGQAERYPMIAYYLDVLERRGRLSSAPISARVIESGKPLFIQSISVRDFIRQYLDEPVSEQESRSLPSEVSVLVLPMRAAGAIVGTLSMYVADTDDKIKEDDIGWVQVVADLTALAIENARLSEETKTHLERFTALDELVHAVVSAHEASVVYDIVVDRVTAIGRIDACDLLLVDDEDKLLVSVASAGFRSTAMGRFRLNLDNPLLMQALDSRRVEYFQSAGVPDRAHRRSAFAREGFMAYAAWPVAWRGKLLGALEVFHRSDLSLDAEATTFITGLARMSAIAVQMASLPQDMLMQPRAGKSDLPVDFNSTEQRILRLLVEGRTNHEIAAEIHLSANTIKFHVRRILDKSGAANRTELARRATREGWV